MHAKGAQVQKKRINNLNPYTKNEKEILLQPCIFLSAVLKDYAKYVLYLQR